MSASSGRGIGGCVSVIFGVTFIIIASILLFIIPVSDSLFGLTFNSMRFGGFILFFVGVALIPSARNETNKARKIIEIAAVRKEVSISDISYETGFDKEYVRKILTQYLVGGLLFGYIEGDLFVRDTAEHRRRSASSERMGMGSIFDD